MSQLTLYNAARRDRDRASLAQRQSVGPRSAPVVTVRRTRAQHPPRVKFLTVRNLITPTPTRT